MPSAEMKLDRDYLLQRASELASSGDFRYLYEIDRRLRSENLFGLESALKKNPTLRNTLRSAIDRSCTPK